MRIAACDCKIRMVLKQSVLMVVQNITRSRFKINLILRDRPKSKRFISVQTIPVNKVISTAQLAYKITILLLLLDESIFEKDMKMNFASECSM